MHLECRGSHARSPLRSGGKRPEEKKISLSPAEFPEKSRGTALALFAGMNPWSRLDVAEVFAQMALIRKRLQRLERDHGAAPIARHRSGMGVLVRNRACPRASDPGRSPGSCRTASSAGPRGSYRRRG